MKETSPSLLRHFTNAGIVALSGLSVRDKVRRAGVALDAPGRQGISHVLGTSKDRYEV